MGKPLKQDRGSHDSAYRRRKRVVTFGTIACQWFMFGAKHPNANIHNLVWPFLLDLSLRILFACHVCKRGELFARLSQSCLLSSPLSSTTTSYDLAEDISVFFSCSSFLSLFSNGTRSILSFIYVHIQSSIIFVFLFLLLPLSIYHSFSVQRLQSPIASPSTRPQPPVKYIYPDLRRFIFCFAGKISSDHWLEIFH